MSLLKDEGNGEMQMWIHNWEMMSTCGGKFPTAIIVFSLWIHSSIIGFVSDSGHSCKVNCYLSVSLFFSLSKKWKWKVFALRCNLPMLFLFFSLAGAVLPFFFFDSSLFSLASFFLFKRERERERERERRGPERNLGAGEREKKVLCW